MPKVYLCKLLGFDIEMLITLSWFNTLDMHIPQIFPLVVAKRRTSRGFE